MLDGPAERTRLARDRTVLAAERTYAAWLRTGLAFLASGLAAEGYLREPLSSGLLRLLSTGLIATSIVSFLAAAWCDWRVRATLASDRVEYLPRLATLGVATLLTIVAMTAWGALWFYRP